jgi:predicted permease
MALDILWQDVRIALRMLRRAPSVSVSAILVLTLGVGVATALYAVVYASWLRPLPYPEHDRLVSVATHFPTYKLDALESADYGEWQGTRSLGPIAAYTLGRSALIGSDDTVEIGRASVSGNLAEVLGVHTVLGRDIQPADDSPSAPRVAILCDGLWRDRFGADRRVLGRIVDIDGERHTIVGVLPPGFRMPEQNRVDILTPLALDPRYLRHGSGGAKILHGLARLQPGITLEKAAAELSTRLTQSRAEEPALYDEHASIRIVPLQTYFSGDLRTAGIVLAGAVAIILLTVTANLGSLLLARAAGREAEMKIRVALGAGASRIARSLLLEGFSIAAVGITAGLALARSLVYAAQRLRPAALARIEAIGISGNVLASAIPAILFCALLFSLAPALRLPRMRLRKALVAGELALSLMLLAGAALMIQSLAKLRAVSPGFRTQQLVTASIAFRGAPSGDGSGQFRRELRARMERAPGTMVISFADSLPPGEWTRSSVFSRADRPTVDPSSRNDAVVIRLVDEHFFKAMGIPLLQGRAFTEADIARDAPVAVVNRTLANRYFAGENALGKLVDGKSWKTVIGVVADTRNDGLRNATRPEIYLPLTDRWKAQGGGVTQNNGLRVILRTAADLTPAADLLRRSVHDIDPALLTKVAVMDEQWGDLLAAPRFYAVVFTGFAVLALTMTCVGVYGVSSHVVVLRRREMAIRLALGARRADVQAIIARDAASLAAVGAVFGTGGALAASRLLAGLLYETSSADPLTLTLSVVLLLVVAVGASMTPARKAAREDPARLLQSE